MKALELKEEITPRKSTQKKIVILRVQINKIEQNKESAKQGDGALGNQYDGYHN